MSDSTDDWLASIQDAIASGPPLVEGAGEFDIACGHIVGLLMHASASLERGSAPLSAFLAITALEETAKLHVGSLRRSAGPIPRHGDPLFNHRKKHHLAAAPTIAMGHRLQAAIGEERMGELVSEARSGALVRLREACLYFERRESGLTIPADVVSSDFARELLLFSIEAFDDALVGYTEHSFALGEETDALFDKWAATLSSGPPDAPR